MVRLRVVEGDRAARLEVSAEARLRDVQRELCRLFRKSFPATMAVVTVVVEGSPVTFDDLQQTPFLTARDGDQVLVRFCPTDDPYFYDLEDRRGCRATAFEEAAFEEAVAQGDDEAVTKGLAAWAGERRAEERLSGRSR
jgi:hypothetical protein